MKETKKWTKWLYWFSFAVAVIFVYKTLDNFNDISIWFNKLLSILMPFLMGILVAYLFYIPCRQIESLYKKLKPKFIKKKARGLSIVTVYIMAILLLVIIINIIIPALSESVVELASSMPGYYNTAMEYVENMPEDAIIKKADVLEIIGNLQKIDITKMPQISFHYDNSYEYGKNIEELKGKENVTLDGKKINLYANIGGGAGGGGREDRRQQDIK